MVTGAFEMDADNNNLHNGRGESSRSDASEEQPNAKRVRVEKELTFKDMYENKELFEEDDEEDTDWEPCPVEKCVEVIKWFCRNCTMDNLDNDICCEVCGEHKDSKILTLGHFASPFGQDGNLNEIQPSMKVMRDFDSQESAANSSTAIGFDERMLLHAEVEKKSHPHPERPDRLRAIVASLTRAGIFPGRCYPIPAREITQEELMMVHSSEHIESVEVTSKLMSSYFTSDTYANKHSACAARLAAGLCADLASAIVSGRVKNGFALVRPPGHHAGVKDVMGFCLHNNAAVAALAAKAAGAKKVLILDWDVHHGNGTQEIFEKNKSVLYISLHRHEGGAFYPGTGGAHEVGYMGAEGYCVNIPWSRGGVSDNDYNFAFQHVVLPIASEFAPDFTIISAGFDAARGDPLGGCDITPSGYAQMTHMLNALSGGKMLVILEGGYNLRSISSSATAVIKVLLGESHVPELENSFPTKSGLQTVFEVLDIQNNFWPSLKPIFENVMSLWEMRCLGKKDKMTDMSVKEQKKLMAAARAARISAGGPSEAKSNLAGFEIRAPKKKKRTSSKANALETVVVSATPVKRPSDAEPAGGKAPKKLKTVMENEANEADWEVSTLLKETSNNSNHPSSENKFWSADFDDIKFLYDHLNASEDVNKQKSLGPQKITQHLSSYLMRCAVLTRSLFESGDDAVKKNSELQQEVKRLVENEKSLNEANSDFKTKALESDEKIKALEEELAMVKTSAAEQSNKLQASEKFCSELKEALDKSRMGVLNAGDMAFDRAKAQVACLYPDLDISEVDFFKSIVDEKLVEVDDGDSDATLSEESITVDVSHLNT